MLSHDCSSAQDDDEVMRRDAENLIRWLRDGLKKPGKTQAELAKKLGYETHSPVAKMLSGKPIRAEQLPVIASYIEEPIPEKFRPQPAPVAGAESVFLVGKVDSSAWREIAVGKPALKTHIPRYMAEPYAFVRQEAFQIDDDSSEPFAKRGEFVVTVDYESVGLEPQHDDIVVTMETREVEGRPETRISLRQIVQRGRSLVLLPLCGPAKALSIDSVAVRYVIGKALYNARTPRL